MMERTQFVHGQDLSWNDVHIIIENSPILKSSKMLSAKKKDSILFCFAVLRCLLSVFIKALKITKEVCEVISCQKLRVHDIKIEKRMLVERNEWYISSV